MNGTEAHQLRIATAHRPVFETRQNRPALLGGEVSVGHDQHRSAVIDAARVSRRDRSLWIERRFQLAESVERRLGASVFVAIQLVDRNQLIREPSRRACRLVSLLAPQRKLILLAARDAILRRQCLRREGHVPVIERIDEAIAQHGIDQHGITEFEAAPRARQQVRRVRHRLGPAAQHGASLTSPDRLRRQQHGLHPRRTHHVHRKRRDRQRQPQPHAHLPRDVHPRPGSEHIADDHLIDLRRIEPPQRGLPCHTSKVHRRPILERSQKSTDRRSFCRDDDGHDDSLEQRQGSGTEDNEANEVRMESGRRNVGWTPRPSAMTTGSDGRGVHPTEPPRIER